MRVLSYSYSGHLEIDLAEARFCDAATGNVWEYKDFEDMDNEEILEKLRSGEWSIANTPVDSINALEVNIDDVFNYQIEDM